MMLTEHPQFFIATILEWKHLLAPDKYKDIIIESPRFLVNHNRKLANQSENYHYSTAKYYLFNVDDFGFITHNGS
jgi:hypothetical protein